MRINTLEFQGIHPGMASSIVAFFESAQVCSTLFKSCTTTRNGKVTRSQDEARKCHKDMGMTVVFAGISKCDLNTQFMTFTIEIRVIQEMEIIDWELTEFGRGKGCPESDGSRTLTIGCPTEIIEQIHRMFEVYGEEIR